MNLSDTKISVKISINAHKELKEMLPTIPYIIEEISCSAINISDDGG